MSDHPAPPVEPVDDSPPAELDPLGSRRGNGHQLPADGPAAPPRPPQAAPEAVAGPIATPEAAFAFYESQLELAEYPAGSNANWLTDWYGMGHVAWCAITVSRALIEAGFGTAEAIDVPGVRATSAKGWAYCPYVEDDFDAATRWYDAGSVTPVPGDLVLYDWDGDGWPDHVGMLKALDDDGSLWVYEGNTDEGVLRLKHRSMTYVLGFARPPWTTTAPPDPPVPTLETDMSYVSIRPGERALIGVPVVDGGAGTRWAAVTVTAPAPGAIIDLAQVWPAERKIDELHQAKSFAGLVNVAMEPGDLAVELVNASPTVIVTVMVESGK